MTAGNNMSRGATRGFISSTLAGIYILDFPALLQIESSDGSHQEAIAEGVVGHVGKLCYGSSGTSYRLGKM
jgi:hypothetical protein